MNNNVFLQGMREATEKWRQEAEKWLYKRAKEIIEEESRKLDTLIEIQNYMMDKQAQDERWNRLSEREQAGWLENYKCNKEDGNKESMKIIEDLFGTHNLNPEPKIKTWEDVARELFRGYKGNTVFYIDQFGEISKSDIGFADNLINDSTNCTSRKQAEKLLAINKLLNVAAYLNKNEDGTPWKPDWENMTPDDKVWSLGIDENKIRAYYVQKCDGTRPEIVFFKTKELAEQAIQILGEDTVRLALGDY